MQRFGRQAQVITRTDTLFLAEFPTGWKVIGVGLIYLAVLAFLAR